MSLTAQQRQEIREYRAKSPAWAASRCPDWCNKRHLTEAIWFGRNDFHMSDTATVHLPAVPFSPMTMHLLETDVDLHRLGRTGLEK